MTEMMPEQPIGAVTALTDLSNVQMEESEEQDHESLEYGYALLAGSPLPAVFTEDEI